MNDRRDGGLLVCVPPAGHDPAVFRSLACRLRRTVQLIAVDVNRHRGAAGIVDAATGIADLGARPTVIFGHSAGAFAALHTAGLLTVGALGPQVVLAAPPRDPAAVARWSRRSDAGLAADLVRLGHLPDAVRLDRRTTDVVITRVRTDLELAISCAEAIETGGLGERVPPVEVWRGRDDPLEAGRDVSAQERTVLGADVGRVRWFDGGHFFPFDDVAVTARLLELIVSSTSGSATGREVGRWRQPTSTSEAAARAVDPARCAS